MVEQSMLERYHAPMLMFDLSIPRDIEPDVAEINNIALYNIDDLISVTDAGIKQRQAAAMVAEQMIEQELNAYLRWHRTLKATHVIRDYRDHMQALADLELTRAKQKMSSGHSQDDVLAEFGKRLVNKLIHLPTLGLKQAAVDDRLELLDLAHTLLKKQTYEKIS